jgi:hypothetical protein
MRNNSFHALLASLTSIGIAACASQITYDPDADEAAARVISKETIASREQKVDGNLITVVPIGGVVVPLYGAATKTQISVFEYTVVDKSGKATKVRSEVSFFEVGQCVNLMTANKPTYPRIAYGAECRGF